jgi:5-hydroxyisourate hydrolase
MNAKGISTHVLDTALGKPAQGVPVLFEAEDGTVLARGVTDADGRIADLLPEGVPAAGVYRIRFDVQSYAQGNAFFPEVVVCVRLEKI